MNGIRGLAEIAETVKKYEAIKQKLKSEVFGQNKAIDDVIDSIENSALYGEKSDKRPKGLFLFAGTPGVGKTFLAQKVAETLGVESLTLNMSSFNAREDSKLALFGMDASWRGAKDGVLLDFVESQHGRPCVVILDEFEKAHMEVILQFLQILESGCIENLFIKSMKVMTPKALADKGYDKDLLTRSDYTSFTNVYLIFTTNAGRSLYENGKQPSADLTKDAIIEAIRKDGNPDTRQPYFPDAVLSRFQTGTVVMFRHLDTDELIQIGRKELIKNIELIESRYGLKIEIQSMVITLLLLKEGGQVDARNFRKITESFIKTQITDLSLSLKQEFLNINKIHIGVDPEERESLDELLYGSGGENEVIFVCEDEYRLQQFGRILKNTEGISIRKTSDYDEAMKMVKDDVFSTPLVFAVLPSVKNYNSLTMASVNNSLQSRNLKNFRDFIEKIKEFNEKAVLCVIDTEHSSEETRKEILDKGASEILEFSDPEEIPSVIEKKANSISLNNMAFDFARKGKALKYIVTPVVYDDTAYLRLRFFEKIENVKAGDDEFLIGKERMPSISFDQVVGGEKIKTEAADFIEFLKNPKAFVRKGLKAPKGLLFYGPAGTGKTYMAKAIANEAGVPFIATNGGDIKMGTSEKNGSELLKQYFAVARRYAPSILFIDEMETIALNRTGMDSYADTIVNTLLAEMDGFDGHDSNPVIVIGATNAGIDRENHVDGRFLDPAVVRRFTRKFFVDVPLKVERLTYLEKSTGLNDRELETAAQMSQGLSYGRINNAVEIAKRLAVRENRAITAFDVVNAIETENYGEARERSYEIMERTAYHEAGHACIGCVLGGEMMPDHATIVSRGNFGGYVGTAGDEKGMSWSKKYMEDRIRAALGGRCAEIIHYGETDGLTAGPSSDIKTAYRLISEMVCHLGMDEKIGITYYENSMDDSNGGLPDRVRERIDELFGKYYDEAMEILKSNNEMFEEIARELIEKESLGRTELERIRVKYYG
ncbi:MAG: AAA family ATPase [Lachnospiraceae bacterium]|nr:AAA family ATPase [Lachnospiraceae bacterium]